MDTTCLVQVATDFCYKYFKLACVNLVFKKILILIPRMVTHCFQLPIKHASHILLHCMKMMKPTTRTMTNAQNIPEQRFDVKCCMIWI